MTFADKVIRAVGKGAWLGGSALFLVGVFGLFLAHQRGVSVDEGWQMRLILMALWGSLWGAALGVGCARPARRNKALSFLLMGVAIAATAGSLLLVTFRWFRDDIGGGIFLAVMMAALTALVTGMTQFSKEKNSAGTLDSTHGD